MESAYRHCEDLVRENDKDRYLATLFAPAELRLPLFSLYAFNVAIAGVRERAREPMPGEIRLQWWRDVLSGERAGEAAANPVAAALTATILRFALPREPLRDLLEARGFDLYDDPMPSLAALQAYGAKTAGTLFAQAASICGGDAGEAAGQAGLAWSITETLRALPRHASRRQLYLPAELLERHDARARDVFAGQATPALRAALTELRAVARTHLRGFETLLASLPAALAPAFLHAALIPGYLQAMEEDGYDPFKSIVDVPQWRRQWVLWRAARRFTRAMKG